MKTLYVTITNLEFEGMTLDEVKAKVIELLNVFNDYAGKLTRVIATDLPHNIEMIDTYQPEGHILHKEVRDQ